MAGVSTPALAAAVSNTGGLGSLGIGASSTHDAQRMIRETQALTDRPFNVNLFCHRPPQRDSTREQAWIAYLAPLFAEFGVAPPAVLEEIYTSFLENDETLSMLLAMRPSIVSFHFGIPSPDRLAAIHQAGIRTMATATNLEEAKQIEAAGIHAIIAQGIEAGGHRGMFDPQQDDEQLSTAVLTRSLAQKTTLPIIAAGGIMDGQGIKAMLDLGASAAQLGTAFILCPESAANAHYRDSIKGIRANKTRLTSAISGRPARGMVNRLISYGERPGSPTPAPYPCAYDAAKSLHAAAAKTGNHEFAAQWAGQGAPLARELPAAQLVKTLLAEMASVR